MAIPVKRDPVAVAATVQDWLATRLPDVENLVCSNFLIPEGTGFSNETYVFDARWDQEGREHDEGLVVRIRPTGYRVFMEDDFALQYRTLEVLGRETAVPVPRVRWYEDDDSVLGAPFWVMDRVDGRAPTDNPPYHLAGWMADATPEDRRSLWHAAMDALAEVHTVPPEKFAFLSKPERGGTGLDQQLRYWGEAMEWAADGRPQPVAEAAWEWLNANLPVLRPTALSWGDSRMGNMLFGPDKRVRAIVDWEMVSLGGPLMDLGWYLFFDDTYAIVEGKLGVARLPGLGDREETVGAWQERTGHPVTDLRWYEIFAGLRYATVTMRLAQLNTEIDGRTTHLHRRETNNNVTHALARIMGLDPPGVLSPYW
jgi:aminoglycoside phosphotransferase (APT) family kinase protein